MLEKCSVAVVACTLILMAGGMPMVVTVSGRPLAGRTQENRSQQSPTVTTEPATPVLRGTDESPLTVRVLPTAKSVDETAADKAARNDQSAANWWLVRLTALMALVGAIQTFVFGLQAYRLKQTIIKMEQIAAAQTTDMQNSIREASRAAGAMEAVAESMALSVKKVAESVAISKDIADRQKLVTELAGRAYLMVAFETAIYQDEGHVFEAVANLSNRGNTPAYDVTFWAASAIVPSPIPDDFGFHHSEANVGHSVSIIGPGMFKILRRTVEGRVQDEEVESIKQGGPRCLLMWGAVNYRDAFHQSRYVKFAFSVYWAGVRPDGTPLIMSVDTASHNDSN